MGFVTDELMSLWLEEYAGADPGFAGPVTDTTWGSCLYKKKKTIIMNSKLGPGPKKGPDQMRGPAA